MTSPIEVRVRPKQFSNIGIGASSIISSRNGPFRDAPNAVPSPTGSSTTPVSEHTRETASFSLSTTFGRSSGLYPNEEPPENIPSNGSSVLPGVDPGPTDGSSTSTQAGEIGKVNTANIFTKHNSDSYPSTSPQDVGNTLPLDIRAPPASTNALRFFFPELSSVQPVVLRLSPPPVNSRDSAPVNLPLSSVNLPSCPILPKRPPSPQTYGIPYVTRLSRKTVVIGMPLDDVKVGGTRGSFPKNFESPPDPSCSLVMETLPRKFRTESFILDWLSQFAFKPMRYELVEGKAFFEFKTQRNAQLAWKSPRMGGVEGLFGVRLFWYRVLSQTTLKDLDIMRKVNGTGTIEIPAQSPQLLVYTDDLSHRSGLKADTSHSRIPTQKVVSLPPSPPYSTVIEEDSGVPVKVNRPTESIRSNSDNQISHGGDSTVPSPAVTTRPSSASTTPSDPPDKRMDADYAMRDLPPGVPGLTPGATALPTVVPTSFSPTSSSASAPCSSRTSPSTFPTSSPEVPNSAVTTALVDHQAPPALNQGQGPSMQASNLAAETSHMETEVKGIEFEKVDGTPLGADDFMDTDTAALAKEHALREMVLQSRKRKLLESSSTKQPTPAATSTVTSGSALQDLAANFIADAIARPPPAKIVKITPSASVMAAWGKRLEQHVESSKAIMAKIQLTRSKAERDRLMAILREKDRCVSW